MPSLQAFDAFVKSTGQKLKSSPDQIINDATKNTYVLERMLRNTGTSQTVQSGERITERIMLKDSGTAAFYLPNENFNIQNVDTLTRIDINWRFMQNHYSYTEQEMKLNSGDRQTYYKNLAKSKRQASKTDTYNFMEEALWEDANAAEMESESGRRPYSIQAFVTRDNTATVNGDTRGTVPTGFTTVETVNPTNEPEWSNQLETYDVNSVTDPDVGLVQAFDDMFLKVRFRAPRSEQEYFERDDLQQMMIATNREGNNLYLRLTRDANDRLVGNNLGAQQGAIGYRNLPVEYIAQLDQELTAGEPAYYFLNLKYLHPVFHSEKYMAEKDPMAHPLQPFTHVVWTDTYYNLACTSRRRQGLIYHTAS